MTQKALHNRIIAWVKSGKNWKEGIGIYEDCPAIRKKLLKRFHRSGPNDYNKGLLEAELRKVAEDIEASFRKSSPANIATSVKISLETNSIDFVTLPAEIQMIEVKKYQAYMEARKIRFELIPATSDKDEIGKLAGKVVELMKENQEYWDQLHDYNKTGKVPVSPPPSPTAEQIAKQEKLTPVQMSKKLQYRRSNISTYRRFIKENPEHPSVEKKRQKIEEWEKEISYYESELSDEKQEE